MKNYNRTRRVGIIGGMGPLASANFLVSLIKECQKKGAKMDSDFPHIFLESISFADSSETSSGTMRLVISSLRKTMKRMLKNKIDFLAIICNTLHPYMDSLLNNFDHKIHFFPMPEIVATHISEKKYKNVLILSSQESKQNKLYNSALKGSGVTLSYADQKCDQPLINKTILNVMEGKIIDARKNLNVVIKKYIENYDCIVLGCTELPLALKNEAKHKIKIVDPNYLLAKVLAEKCISI